MTETLTKVCGSGRTKKPGCGRELPLTEYTALPQGVLGVNAHCRRCRAYNDKQGLPEGGWREKHFKKKYRLSTGQWQQLWDAQGGRCALCKTHDEDIDRRSNMYSGLVVDHCHDTGMVRGLLCNPCNSALGLLKENVAIAHAMELYLITPTAAHIDLQAVAPRRRNA